MKRKSLITEWEKTWDGLDSGKLNIAARLYLEFVRRDIKKILETIRLPKKSKVIDVGCGTGRTLLWLKGLGFKNLIGVDITRSSLKHCKKIGIKNVYLMDVFGLKYKTEEFDLVFSEGLVEHFNESDFISSINEICRVSRKYVLFVQPNRASLYRKLVNLYYMFVDEKGPPERDYQFSDFNKAFSKNGFYLQDRLVTMLGGFWILLFQRNNDG